MLLKKFLDFGIALPVDLVVDICEQLERNRAVGGQTWKPRSLGLAAEEEMILIVEGETETEQGEQNCATTSGSEKESAPTAPPSSLWSRALSQVFGEREVVRYDSGERLTEAHSGGRSALEKRPVLRVTQVVENSVAAKAGLTVGDRILKIGGEGNEEPATTVNQLVEATWRTSVVIEWQDRKTGKRKRARI